MILKLRKSLEMLLLAGFLASGSAGGSDFNIGTAGVRGMTIEKEKELGQYFMIVARSQLPIVYDPVLGEYLTGIVGRMAAQAQGVRYPFDSFLLRIPRLMPQRFSGERLWSIPALLR